MTCCSSEVAVNGFEGGEDLSDSVSPSASASVMSMSAALSGCSGGDRRAVGDALMALASNVVVRDAKMLGLRASGKGGVAGAK